MTRSPAVLLLLPLLLASCSSSRLVKQDRVLDAGPQKIGSLIESDVLVPDGASLKTNYLASSRIFVSSCGSLSGLNRGIKNSTIFAERGAILPPLGNRSVRVRRVENAAQAYENRFSDLLPADAEGRGGGAGAVGVGGAAFVGGGYFGGGFGRFGGGRFGRGRFGRGGFGRGGFGRGGRGSVSVRGSSSRSRR